MFSQETKQSTQDQTQNNLDDVSSAVINFGTELQKSFLNCKNPRDKDRISLILMETYKLMKDGVLQNNEKQEVSFVKILDDVAKQDSQSFVSSLSKKFSHWYDLPQVINSIDTIIGSISQLVDESGSTKKNRALLLKELSTNLDFQSQKIESNEKESSAPPRRKKRPSRYVFDDLIFSQDPQNPSNDIMGQLDALFSDRWKQQSDRFYQRPKKRFQNQALEDVNNSSIVVDDSNDKKVQQELKKGNDIFDQCYEKACQQLNNRNDQIKKTHQKDIIEFSNVKFEPQYTDLREIVNKLEIETQDAMFQAQAEFEKEINSIQEISKKIKEIATTADNVVQTLHPEQILQDSIKSYGAWTAKPFQSKNRRFLKPTKHKVILISNENYENVRSDFQLLKDIEQSPLRTKTFRRFCTEYLQIDSNDIIQLDNPTRAMVHGLILKLRRMVDQRHNSNPVQLCLWIYVTGQGVMNTTQYIVLNERCNKDRFYPLQKEINDLIYGNENAAAFVFFENNRLTIPLEMMKAENPNADLFIEKDHYDDAGCSYYSEYQNVISVFACNENEDLPMKSNLAQITVDVLTDELQENGGVLIFPSCLTKICEKNIGSNYRVECTSETWVDVSRSDIQFRPSDRKWINSEPAASDSTTFQFPSSEQVAESKSTELQQLTKISFEKHTKNWQFETSAGCKSDFDTIDSEMITLEINQSQNRIKEVKLFSQNSCLSGMILIDDQDKVMNIGQTTIENQSEIEPQNYQTIYLQEGERIIGVRGKTKNQSEKSLYEFQFITKYEDKFAQIKHQLVQKKMTLSQDFNETHLVKSDLFDLYHKEWIKQTNFENLQVVRNVDMSGSIYSGFVSQDQKKNGWGRLTTRDDNLGETWYVGQWVNDTKCGFGKMIHSDGTQQVGFWKDDLLTGLGKEQSQSRTVYEGQYHQGKRHGMGTMKFADGSIYCGEFKNDCQHGLGEQTWYDGQKFIGEWDSETETVKGKMKEPNGVSYQHQMPAPQILKTK